MDERRDPQTDAPDEGELLAAYLAAETDDLTSARIERRLLEDPAVADRLDALARTRQRLQRLDDVQPPPELRARLDARLRAERSGRAEPATGGAHTAGAHAGDSARAAGGHSHRRFGRRWFPPLATAAALVVAAVIGGTALLNMSAGTSSEESAGSAADTAAEAPAAEGPVAEPFAAPDSGGESAEGGDAAGGEAAQQELSDRADEDAGGPDAAAADGLPRVADDADITARLRDEARSTDQPALREAELRRRSGMPAQPLCLTDSTAAAVDLVERDGRIVLTALVADGSRSRVVLFDPGDCTRLRAFTP